MIGEADNWKQSELGRFMLDDPQPSEFVARAFYHPHGDSIEFIAKPDPYYAERLDDLVTVYLSETNGEVIGSLIKSVNMFCKSLSERLPGFLLDLRITEGEVELRHLFRAAVWTSEPDAPQVTCYRRLAEIAEETDAKTELACA